MNAQDSENIVRRSARVHGWFSVEAAKLISMADEVQRIHHIEGDIFEIGVHHGKSSIFFSHLLRKSENLHVCDLFGEMGNVSSSGSGDEQIFIANMAKLGAKAAAVSHKCLSSTLTPERIGKNYRMFHVDGGHNPDEALSDMELGSKVLHEKGVIIVDDPFRVEWPGVTEAIVRFLDQNKEYEGIVVGFNKFLIAKKPFAETYKAFIADKQNREAFGLIFPWEFKQLPFCGSNLNLFFISMRYFNANGTRIFLSKVRRRLRGK
jgi:hypothetical protein